MLQIEETYRREPGSRIYASPGAIGAGRSTSLWTKPFPIYPLTVSGLVYGMWGDRMTHTGQGSAVTAIEDLSGNGANVSGGLITQPATADLDIFNNHPSVLIETGGHFEPSSAPIFTTFSGNDPNWYAIAGIRLITNSVDNNFFCAGNTAGVQRHLAFSTGALRNMRCRRVDNAAAGVTVSGDTLITAEGTTYEFYITGSGAGTTCTLSYGGDTQVLMGNPQNVGVATMNAFSVGASITAGVLSATSRFYLRFLFIYNVVPAAPIRSNLRVWAANDSYQQFN